MWKCTLVLAVAVGCSKSGGEAAPKPDPAIAAAALERVPRIETADVLAIDDGRPPPVLVLIDDAGAVQIAAAATWRELATRDLRIGARPIKLEVAAEVLRASRELHRTPSQIVEAIGAAPATLRPANDPPPPEKETEPEDEPEEEEEAGGTRVAITLDEGDMNRRAAQSAEARELERQQTARARQKFMVHRFTGWRGRRMIVEPDDGSPTRLATTVGAVSSDGRFEEEPPAVVLAAPRGRGSALIRALSATDGLIAVVHRGEIRALRLSFVSETDGSGGGRERPWIEVRVSTAGVALEAVPEAPVVVSWQAAAIDRGALAAALDATRKSRTIGPLAPVDVLVEPDVDVQRLVDLLVALDLVGVRMIGLGEAPASGSPQAAQRGRRMPRVTQGRINTQGDLDKLVIRAHIGGKRAEIRACYEAALVTKPDLKGTVMVQLFIAPTGLVVQSSASGVDPKVAECVAGVIKGVVFPKPKGGGGVQVNQAFSLRP